jgi:hypothetical protein
MRERNRYGISVRSARHRFALAFAAPDAKFSMPSAARAETRHVARWTNGRSWGVVVPVDFGPVAAVAA